MDIEDIERFVRQHELLMHGFVRRRVPDVDVDDVVQNVFVAVWRREQEGEVIVHASFPIQRAWLYKAALFEIAAYSRAHGRAERLKERLWSYMRITGGRVDDRASADIPLHRALARLERDDRDILKAAVYDGFSTVEIATLLSCSEGAARQRLHRAIGRLRVLYARELRRQ